MGRKFEVRKVAMAKTMLHKTRVYSRFGKEIYMCAKLSGGNPDNNLTLKHLIEKAKKAQVPGDVIKRNIDKAEKGIGEDFIPIRYEGFGPGGISFLVDTLTDNVNRTVSLVKNCFTKTNGNMGVAGCVEHGYSHLSYVTVKGMDEETVFETLLMADLDIKDLSEENGLVEIEAEGYDMSKIEDVLTEAGAEVVESERAWYPLDTIEIDDEIRKQFDKFISMTDDIEDVQQVYHNVKEVDSEE